MRSAHKRKSWNIICMLFSKWNLKCNKRFINITTITNINYFFMKYWSQYCEQHWLKILVKIQLNAILSFEIWTWFYCEKLVFNFITQRLHTFAIELTIAKLTYILNSPILNNFMYFGVYFIINVQKPALFRIPAYFTECQKLAGKVWND